MLDADDFAVNARRPRPAHPKGWEPGFEWDGKSGTLISDPITTPESPKIEALMADMGFDPATHEVVGPVQVRRWQQTPGDDWLYYNKITVKAVTGGDTDVDVDALCARVAARKPRRGTTYQGDAGLVLGLGDWQVGKGDGDGVEGTIARLFAIPDLMERRWRDLRKIGVPLSVIYLCFGGDLRESCHGHYPSQSHTTQLNNRDQRKIVREAADRIIDRAAKIAPGVGVKVVGGNHGEEREGGKAITTPGDNVDVAVIEDVAYAYAHTDGRYDHVSFAIPNDDLTLTFDHEGLIVGMAHGHQAGFGSGDPRTKIHNWWKSQMDGQQPIGDADILLTFHYHHPWLIQRGARTHIGTAAQDGGSQWFKSATGQDAPPSTTSFVVTGTGWSNYELLA